MAILNRWTQDFSSTSVEQTVRLGVRLGELLEMGDVICLEGELGMGKTAFTRGVGRGWGASVRVTSPSYTLINEYPRLKDGRVLYHIDGYRLESEADTHSVGFDDIFDSDGAIIIEWPSRIEGWLPADRLWVAMAEISMTRRSMRFTASGDRSAALLNAFTQHAFGT